MRTTNTLTLGTDRALYRGEQVAMMYLEPDSEEARSLLCLRQPGVQPLGRDGAAAAAAHYLWAVLIARIYEVFPLLCAVWRADAPDRIYHRWRADRQDP